MGCASFRSARPVQTFTAGVADGVPVGQFVHTVTRLRFRTEGAVAGLGSGTCFTLRGQILILLVKLKV